MREIARDVRDHNLRGRWSPDEIVGDVHAGDRARCARLQSPRTVVPGRDCGRCASSLPAASRRRNLQNYTRAIADRKRPAPLLRNPSAPRTWTRHRASSGRERLSSARRRPGASPRSNARRSASWRRWHILLCLQMLRRHCLSRTAPGSRASRSRLRVELVGPSR